MQIATLLFYSLAAFFLGVIATASAPVIAAAFGEPARWDSPVVMLVVAATVAGPLFFLALALVAAIRGDTAPGAGRSRHQPAPSEDSGVTDALRWLNDVEAAAPPDQRPAAEKMQPRARFHRQP